MDKLGFRNVQLTENFVYYTFQWSRQTNVVLGRYPSQKNCSTVSDENALRGTLMLLEETTAIWWMGVKVEILDWNHAMNSFRDACLRKLPTYPVFREMFSRKQKDDESWEIVTRACFIGAIDVCFDRTMSNYLL